MFIVTEEAAAAIRAALIAGGELAGAIELQRRFPGIEDNAKARSFACLIAGWRAPPKPPKLARKRGPRIRSD
jgi:hypothetical protein